MSDTNAKLDKIIGMLETVIERQQEQEEQTAELREALAERGLPGSGFSTFEVEED
jgi:hypothetical protein